MTSLFHHLLAKTELREQLVNFDLKGQPPIESLVNGCTAILRKSPITTP